MYDELTSLKVKAAELAAIIECIPDAVYIGGPNGILRANKKALDMLGFDTLEELNQQIEVLADKIKTRDLHTGKRLTTEEEPFYKAFFGESNERDVLTTHIKSGKEIIVRCSAAPVIVDGQIIAAIAINTDITEKVQNKRELESVVKKLKRQNEELDKFVYTTSHDLKAPLNTIDPILQIVKDENKSVLKKDSVHLLDMAIKKVRDMSDFIHSLLKSATTLEKVKELVDLNKILNKVIASLDVPSNINIFVRHNLPAVYFHKYSLMQIFQNLLSNAIKFMDKERGVIKIDCRQSDDKYIISVSDNGPGIAKHELEKIFERFGQVNKDLSKDSSGLGLSIVKDILKENDGSVWAESEINEGTTFYFMISKS
ncbi:MAG: PAS domain-containing sensor histidine kinase [Sporocytophaga sp.]|uniref:sensor histidine kinase n=1 Tax=Sporocytophaga sp. TaxID=2231183 RepID=UPI001B058697|nr:PAS domain-containing sensor histidine kinase [Sporocytophaga sp.]MBO9699511.1 PAS domain-containing sensor histidine kinase [Sporocytophaga sp.]